LVVFGRGFGVEVYLKMLACPKGFILKYSGQLGTVAKILDYYQEIL
jgi:hypothetical protein